ncbi:MAG: hypothetical protein ABSE89_03550 [Sedimentisphaerales bacterium]
MKQMPQKSVDRPAGSRQRVAAEARKTSQRKKLAIAFVLFFMMAVLWVRIFVIKGGPKTASAAPDVNLIGAGAGSAVSEIVYTDLPVIAGREDVLADDLFAARNFKGFKKVGESTAEGESDTADANEQLSGDLAAAVAQMELTAIVNDKKPQAFIEDNLLEVGQGFKFVYHGRVYNFKVVKILEDRVELECNGTIVTKKIPESLFKAE